MLDSDYIPKHFCESHYSQSSSEPINALSSLIILFYGIYGLINAKQNKVIATLYSYLCLIGIGSTLYHYNLSIQNQLLDEFPMTLCIMNGLQHILSKYYNNNPLVYIYVCTFILISLIASVFYEFVFHVFFGFAVIQLLYYMSYYMSYYKTNRVKYGSYMMLFSLILWLVYENMCKYIQYLQYIPIHSVWHICVAHATYLLIESIKEIDETEQMSQTKNN